MTAYSTLDYLPDLTTSEINKAGTLMFSPYTAAGLSWDNRANVYGSESYAILHSLYKFSATAGATYDIFSSSYFDPYVVIIYDANGNAITANSETDDPADSYLGDGYYGQDVIWDWVAPYTGTYFVNASWNQGSYFKFYSFSIYEDVNTAAPAPAPAPAPTPAPAPAPSTLTFPQPTSATAKMITGTDSADALSGTTRADAISGGKGNDTATGLDGNDFLTGGKGNDNLNGATGIDTAVFSGAFSAYTVTINRDTGVVTVAHSSSGNDGTDTTQNFELYRFSDRIISAIELKAVKGTPVSTMVGTDGNDNLSGSLGDDYLTTGKGTDSVSANSGNDFISAGKGIKTINGGAGSDTVIYSGDTLGTITKRADGTASIVRGSDTYSLIDVERYKTTKEYVILDLDAGQLGRSAVSLAFTLKGLSGVRDGTLLASNILPLLDQGFSLAEVSSYLIDSGYVASLAGGTSNLQLISMVYKAVTGTTADSSTLSSLESLITSGTYTQATLLAGVAELELVGSAINFSQYAGSGLALNL